jgi:LPXTG-motif cell wall-anchored protein
MAISLVRAAGLLMAGAGLAVTVTTGVAAASASQGCDPSRAACAQGEVEETSSPEESEEPAEEVSLEPSETVSEEPSEEVSLEPSEAVSEEPSEEPSEESGGPVVEPSDPEPSISPTVLGVKITRAPAPVASLPNTGSTDGTLAVLGLVLVALGAGLVCGAGRYQRQH